MTTTPSSAIGEALLQQMAAEIREEIPEAEVRLLITVTDDWLAQYNRFEVLDRLR